MTDGDSMDAGSDEDGASQDATDGAGPSGSGPPCDDHLATVWRDPDSGQCYRVSDEWVTWDVAQATCERDGGYLAVIRTAREQVFVSDILWEGTPEAAVYEAWIGLSRAGQEESFAWVDGSALEQAQWQEGEPNEQDATSCGYAREENAWRWHDTQCNNTMPYVCEWTPGPSGDG